MRTVDAAPLPGSYVGPARRPATVKRAAVMATLRLAWRRRDRGLTDTIARAELGRETGVRC